MMSTTSTPRRKLSAIVMVDVSGFSRMMGRDEERTTALIREFHSRIRSIVENHEGRVVDTAGDSVFGEFDSVVNGVRCAQAIQDTQAAANASRPPEECIETRIGVHLGDVIVQDYQVYGDGVNIAARLQALAEPGSICVSEAVYQQVFQKLDLDFEDLGIRKLKNIEYPIRLYRVALGGRNLPGGAAQEPQEAPPGPGPAPGIPPSQASWTDAFLARGGLIPLVIGLILLTAPLGLFPFPQGGIAPLAGTVLTGIGLGRILSRKTGRQGWLPIALGAGIAAGASFVRLNGLWNLPLVFVGLIVALRGLRGLRAPESETPGQRERRRPHRRRH
ncbi:MAG TPA: adenylate/guanylate cyclase domain-containing protein [Syntrophorhabdales bacterium]|nr:adenylate/guanylate cyclase domain-containing protein [Syntrophorhabdales bacterium]